MFCDCGLVPVPVRIFARNKDFCAGSILPDSSLNWDSKKAFQPACYPHQRYILWWRNKGIRITLRSIPLRRPAAHTTAQPGRSPFHSSSVMLTKPVDALQSAVRLHLAGLKASATHHWTRAAPGHRPVHVSCWRRIAPSSQKDASQNG